MCSSLRHFIIVEQTIKSYILVMHNTQTENTQQQNKLDYSGDRFTHFLTNWLNLAVLKGCTALKIAREIIAFIFLSVELPVSDLGPRLWTRPVYSLVAHSDIYWRLWRWGVCKLRRFRENAVRREMTGNVIKIIDGGTSAQYCRRASLSGNSL